MGATELNENRPHTTAYQGKSHLKLQQCVNERNISSHILPIKYDTKRCLGYPVCLTLLLVRHTTLNHV